MSLGTQLGKVWNGIISGDPEEWSIVDLGPSDGIGDDSFKIDASYLSLSISAMRLVNRRELLTEFAPFAAFALEIPSANGTDRSIPILFDPRQKIEEMLKTDSQPDTLPIRDVLVLKSLPVTFDRFNLLGGLFRRKCSDMGDIVLDLLSGLSKTSVGAPIGSFLEPAEIAYNGLKTLLTGPEVKMQVGAYRGFRIPTNQPMTNLGNGSSSVKEILQPGRIAFIAGANLAAEDLVFDDGNLMAVLDGDHQKAARLAATDSVVITVESTPRREGYEDLPCHAIWLKIADLIWEDRIDEAEKLHWPQLGKSIVVSDALVGSEKTDLLQVYVVRFQNEVARRQSFISPLGGKSGGSEGPSRGPMASGGVSRRLRVRAEEIRTLGSTTPNDADATANELLDLATKIDAGKLELANGGEGADRSPPNTELLNTVFSPDARKLGAAKLFSNLTSAIYR